MYCKLRYKVTTILRVRHCIYRTRTFMQSIHFDVTSEWLSGNGVNVFSEKCLGASQGELLWFAVWERRCVKRIFVGYPYAVARRKLCDNMCPINGEFFEGRPL